MVDNTVQLTSLPVELLHNVFRQLDPVGLIATSQTCTHFRSIIQPTRKHFAERLLALEIEPEHGGPAFRYFSRENRLEPDWNEDAWDHMRWACTHCLRLLGHAAFDNHMLLRLRNRKPAPGSPAAIRLSGVTSWEPVGSRALSRTEERRRRVLVAEEKAQEKVLKKQYHFANTHTGPPAISTAARQARTALLRWAELPEALKIPDEQLDALTDEEKNALLNREALRIEGLRAGSHRHLRKCNECRFQLGHFKDGPFIIHRDQHPGRADDLTLSCNNNKGVPEIPIVRSRRLKFAKPLDRYFPGIAPYMSVERPSFIRPLQRIYREDATYMPNTMYMARCPSCETWQELRSFRWRPRGWGYGEFIGIGCWMRQDEVDAHFKEVRMMQCNKCVYHYSGHAVLAKLLQKFMRSLLEQECCFILNILSSQWRGLQDGVMADKARHGRLASLVKSLEAAQKKFKMVKHREGWSEIDIYADDVEDNLALMNRRRLEWLHISNEEKELASDCVERSAMFAIWQDDWDEAVGYWRWAQAWMAEIEKEPERVVRWALERDQMKLN